MRYVLLEVSIGQKFGPIHLDLDGWDLSVIFDLGKKNSLIWSQRKSPVKIRKIRAEKSSFFCSNVIAYIPNFSSIRAEKIGPNFRPIDISNV